MIDPRDRVLLVRLEYPQWTGWILPGGGKEGDEDDAAALRRELAEETGVPQVFIGPPLWVRRMVRPGMSVDYDGQEETVYLVPCHHFEIRPTMPAHQLRSEGLVEHRWWSVEELAVTDQDVRPLGMAELVRDILEFGAPATPHLFED